MNDYIEKKSVISVKQCSIPDRKATKVTVDNSFARIVLYEKEDMTNEEIYKVLNVSKCTKIDIDKHYERIKGEDRHCYTIYTILI